MRGTFFAKIGSSRPAIQKISIVPNGASRCSPVKTSRICRFPRHLENLAEICPQCLFLLTPGVEIPDSGREIASPHRSSSSQSLGHLDCFCGKLVATVACLMLVESFMHNPAPLNPTPRPSRCIKRSRELERQRIDRMSVEERIRLALGLQERLARLLPGPATNDPHAASA